MPAPYGVRQLSNWILDYAAQRDVGLSNMSLNKLLYFAYEHALLLHSSKLTNARIEAWEHGPVFREVYRAFKDHGHREITSRAVKYDPATDALQVASPELDPSDAALVEEAIGSLVHLPASILRELSHAADGPWAATWYHQGSANPGMQITDDVIRASNMRREVRQ